MGNKGRGEKTKMNKGRREGQGERANNNKEFSYVFVWCLFRSLIGPKSGQNPKKKKHPNLQPHKRNEGEKKSFSSLLLLSDFFFFFAQPLSLFLLHMEFYSGWGYSSNEKKLTKEEKKAVMQQKREDVTTKQRGDAKKRREDQALRRKKEKEEREAAFLVIDQEIEKLTSRSHWEMTVDERVKVKKKILELKNKKKTFLERGQGRKVFIGKFSFDDLKEKLKLNPPLQGLYKGSRKTIFQDEMIAAFGGVERWEWLEEKGCLFVTFEEKEGAEKALNFFCDYEKKKEFVGRVNKRMEEKRVPPVAFIRPMFYVRWPRNYQGHVEREKE